VIEYGTNRTTLTINDHYFEGNIDKTMVQKTVRIKVSGVEQETTAFLEFSDSLRQLRQDGRLTHDPEDKTTLPSFTIHYPKADKGTYFIILNWCEDMVKSG
jgi:hypothetical protein